MKKLPHRVIWAFALGYFIFYTPYAALTKAVTSGIVPGIERGLSGFELLPTAIFGTIAALVLIITLLGWWKYADVRLVSGVPIPVTTRPIVISGFGTALIIATTTIAYTFSGISIVLALLMMRGGLLIIGPVVDTFFSRRVRWFSWAALAISFLALFVSLRSVHDYSLPLAAAVNLAGYLVGYSLRVPCMTKVAKVHDVERTRRYFVQESLVAMVALAVIPVALALTGAGPLAMGLRRGLTSFWSAHPAAVAPALAIGVFYAGLYVFGTLIYLDGRENTFCTPLFCGSSFLAGFAAVLSLARVAHFPAPPMSQLISASMIVGALVLLSPAHHVFEDAWAFIRGRGGELKGATLATSPSRLILFVCSGNTCRSPMAAAIANAEIALRLGIPFEQAGENGLRAGSAGLAARTGEPMTRDSHSALDALGVPGQRSHIARPLTNELIESAEAIYAMTRAQRDAVVRDFPAAAGKAHCLDPDGDVADPIGLSSEVYLKTATKLKELVTMRFDELGVFPLFTSGAAGSSTV